MDSIDIGQPYSTCDGVEADTETERTHLVRFHRLPNVSCLFHCYRVSKKFQTQIWASLRFILISRQDTGCQKRSLYVYIVARSLFGDSLRSDVI